MSKAMREVGLFLKVNLVWWAKFFAVALALVGLAFVLGGCGTTSTAAQRVPGGHVSSAHLAGPDRTENAQRASDALPR